MVVSSPAVATSTAPVVGPEPGTTEPSVVAQAVDDLPAAGPVRIVTVSLDGARPQVEVLEAADPRSAERLIRSEASAQELAAVGVDSRVSAATGSLPASTNPSQQEQWPWSLGKVRAEEAWSGGGEGQDSVVAVIDSGVDGTHPDLRGQVLPGVDLVTGTGDGWDDEYGHGTHVAGIIAAVKYNGIGVVGAAHRAQLLPVRVLDSDGLGYSSDIADGILLATDLGADVINLSLGGPEDDEWVAFAVQYAVSQGVVVVAAAGNEGLLGNPISYPAAYPDVIAVGTSSVGDSIPRWSSRHSYVDLVAPGVDVLSTVPGGLYAESSGSSVAAPQVSAAAAVLQATHLEMETVAQVRAALECSAVEVGARGRDTASGVGRLDMAAAVAALRGCAPRAVSPPGLPRDLTNDGVADVLAIDTGGRLLLHPGSTVGAGPGRAVQVGSGWQSRDLVLHAGDWDGDGWHDLIARGRTDGSLWLYRGNGHGGWLGSTRIGTGWGGFDTILSPSDWNGDGNPDLVARSTDGSLWLYPGNGRGGFGKSARIGTGWSGLREIAVAGDSNSDGRPDLVAVGPGGELWLYRGNGYGGFSGRVLVGTRWEMFRTVVGLGTFRLNGNFDTTPDLVTVATSGAAPDWLGVYFGNGRGGYGTPAWTSKGWLQLRLVR